MDLSKAFGCIPHEFLIAKPSAYGLNGNAMKYIYTYLKNRKQCVRINNVYSGFTVGPILFDGFLNDFSFCITKASVHSFTHKKLSSFAKSVALLVDILIAKSQNAIKLFSEHGFLNGFLNMVSRMVFRHFCVFFATLRTKH